MSESFDHGELCSPHEWRRSRLHTVHKKKGVTRRMTPFCGKEFSLIEMRLLRSLARFARLLNRCHSRSWCRLGGADGFVVSSVNPFDVRQFFAGAAEPDVDILGLCAEFQRNVFHTSSCFASVREEREDLLFQSSTLAAFARFARFAAGFTFRSGGGFRCCDSFWCCDGSGLAGCEGCDFLIDRSNFIEQRFFLFGESQKSA